MGVKPGSPRPGPGQPETRVVSRPDWLPALRAERIRFRGIIYRRVTETFRSAAQSARWLLKAAAKTCRFSRPNPNPAADSRDAFSGVSHGKVRQHREYRLFLKPVLYSVYPDHEALTARPGTRHRNTCSSVASIWFRSTGFAICPCIPASCAAFWSSLNASAVMARIGIPARAGSSSARIARAAW